MAFDPNKLAAVKQSKLAAVKQSKSGFDPAKLHAVKQATPPTPQEQGIFGKTLDVLGTPGRGIAALAYGAGQVPNPIINPNEALNAIKHPSESLQRGQEVLQTMSDIAQPGFQPQDTAQSAANVAGTLTNVAIPVGKGLDLLKNTGIAQKTGAIAKGLVGSVPSLGAKIANTEKIAGLATDKVVSIPKGGQGLTKALQDIKDTGDLVKSGLKQDTPEFAQQLKDYYDKASGILDQGPKAIGKKNYALAAQAKEAINDALNNMIPGRDTAQLSARTAYIRNNAAKLGIVGLAANKLKDVIVGTLSGGGQ